MNSAEATPWKGFRVGNPSTRDNWSEPTCAPFSTISHVTHVHTALDIVRDRCLRPQLVFDESKLKSRRILVNWLSPNHWTRGYRYGNVAFDFEWAALVEGRKCYWVEVMPYKPEACRFLLTRKDYIQQPDMIPYDPSRSDGPWWYDAINGQHYFNSRFCIEVMLEEELPPSSVAAISFVKHHESYCCIDPSGCPDRGLMHQEAAALFVSGAIARNLNCIGLPFVQANDGSLTHRDPIYGGVSWLREELRGLQGSGEMTANDPAASAVARAIAAAHHRLDSHEMKLLARLFTSGEEVAKAAEPLIIDTFGLSPRSLT